MAPAMSRRAYEPGHCHFTALQLPNVMGIANGVDQVARGFFMDHSANFFGNEVGVGAGWLVALVAPGFIGGHGFTADKLERLGAGLIAERLTLQVRRDREN